MENQSYIPMLIKDVPIGAEYKYRKEDVGVFTILARDEICLGIKRHCGRTSTVLNDNTKVYLINI